MSVARPNFVAATFFLLITSTPSSSAQRRSTPVDVLIGRAVPVSGSLSRVSGVSRDLPSVSRDLPGVSRNLSPPKSDTTGLSTKKGKQLKATRSTAAASKSKARSLPRPKPTQAGNGRVDGFFPTSVAGGTPSTLTELTELSPTLEDIFDALDAEESSVNADDLVDVTEAVDSSSVESSALGSSSHEVSTPSPVLLDSSTTVSQSSTVVHVRVTPDFTSSFVPPVDVSSSSATPDVVSTSGISASPAIHSPARLILEAQSASFPTVISQENTSTSDELQYTTTSVELTSGSTSADLDILSPSSSHKTDRTSPEPPANISLPSPVVDVSSPSSEELPFSMTTLQSFATPLDNSPDSHLDRRTSGAFSSASSFNVASDESTSFAFAISSKAVRGEDSQQEQLASVPLVDSSTLDDLSILPSSYKPESTSSVQLSSSVSIPSSIETKRPSAGSPSTIIPSSPISSTHSFKGVVSTSQSPSEDFSNPDPLFPSISAFITWRHSTSTVTSNDMLQTNARKTTLPSSDETYPLVPSHLPLFSAPGDGSVSLHSVNTSRESQTTTSTTPYANLSDGTNPYDRGIGRSSTEEVSSPELSVSAPLDQGIARVTVTHNSSQIDDVFVGNPIRITTPETAFPVEMEISSPLRLYDQSSTQSATVDMSPLSNIPSTIYDVSTGNHFTVHDSQKEKSSNFPSSFSKVDTSLAQDFSTTMLSEEQTYSIPSTLPALDLNESETSPSSVISIEKTDNLPTMEAHTVDTVSPVRTVDSKDNGTTFAASNQQTSTVLFVIDPDSILLTSSHDTSTDNLVSVQVSHDRPTATPSASSIQTTNSYNSKTRSTSIEGAQDNGPLTTPEAKESLLSKLVAKLRSRTTTETDVSRISPTQPPSLPRPTTSDDSETKNASQEPNTVVMSVSTPSSYADGTMLTNSNKASASLKPIVNSVAAGILSNGIASTSGDISIYGPPTSRTTQSATPISLAPAIVISTSHPYSTELTSSDEIIATTLPDNADPSITSPPYKSMSTFFPNLFSSVAPASPGIWQMLPGPNESTTSAVSAQVTASTARSESEALSLAALLQTSTTASSLSAPRFHAFNALRTIDLAAIFGWRKPHQRIIRATDCGCPSKSRSIKQKPSANNNITFQSYPAFAKVSHYYVESLADEISVVPGDIITEVQVHNAGWTKGCLRGRRGLFPSNYAKVAYACPVPNTPFVFGEPDDDMIGPCEPPPFMSVMAEKGKPSKINPPSFSEALDPEKPLRLRMEAVVEFDYTAQEVDELTIQKGDVISDIRMQPGGWWEGCLHGRRGMFPDNFVKVRDKGDINSIKETMANNEVQLRSTSGRKCKVLFSYQPANDDELELQLNDVIEILDEVEEGWWRGKLRNRIGVFPSNFVSEVTEKQTNGGPGSRKTSATQPPPLSMVRKEEILSSGVIISETDSPASPTGPDSGNPNALDVDTDAPTLPPKPVKELCRVLYPYDAANEDELTLKEGDIITIVTKDVQDKGWWKGELRGRTGVFPDNFVSPIPQDEHPQTKKPDRPPIKVTQPASAVRPKDNAVKPSIISNATVTKKGVEIKSEDKHPPALSKKPALPPTAKKPQLRTNSSSINNQVVQPQAPVVSALKRMTTDRANSPEQRLNDLVDGTASSRMAPPAVAANAEMDFDGVERSAMLTHPTASRAKAPRRRLPTANLNKENDQAGGMTNGNDVHHDQILENHVNNDVKKENGTTNPSPVNNASSGSSSNRNSKEWEKNKAPWMEELKMSQAAKKGQNVKTPPAPVTSKSEAARIKIETIDSPASPASPTTPEPVTLRQHNTTNNVSNSNNSNSATAPISTQSGARPQSMHAHGEVLRFSTSPGSGTRPLSMYSPVNNEKSSPASTAVVSASGGATVPMKQFLELVEKVSKLEHHCEVLTRSVNELSQQVKEEREKRFQVQQELEKLTDLVTQV